MFWRDSGAIHCSIYKRCIAATIARIWIPSLGHLRSVDMSDHHHHHHHQLVYCSHVHTLDSHIMKNWHRSSQLNSGYQLSTTHQHILNSVLSTTATSPVIARSQPPTARLTGERTQPGPQNCSLESTSESIGMLQEILEGTAPGHRRPPDLCRATGYVIRPGGYREGTGGYDKEKVSTDAEQCLCEVKYVTAIAVNTIVSAVEASGKDLVFLGKSLVHHFGKNLVASVS